MIVNLTLYHSLPSIATWVSMTILLPPQHQPCSQKSLFSGFSFQLQASETFTALPAAGILSLVSDLGLRLVNLPVALPWLGEREPGGGRGTEAMFS